MAVITRALPRRPHGRGRGLLRALQVPAATVLACLAVLGTVTRPGTTLALGTVLAGVTWALVRHLHSDHAPDLPALPHPAVPATAAVVVAAAVTGTATLGTPAVGIIGALVSAPVAVARWCGGPRRPPLPQGGHRPAGQDEAALVGLLHVLPLEELCREWRDTARPEPGEPQEAAARARLRVLVVAEMGRRDPEGTRRWLLEAPDAPPEGYVGDPRERPLRPPPRRRTDQG